LKNKIKKIPISHEQFAAQTNHYEREQNLQLDYSMYLIEQEVVLLLFGGTFRIEVTKHGTRRSSPRRHPAPQG
jgi:hypothetical protein